MAPAPGPAIASTSYLLPEGLLLHSHKALFILVSWPPSFWDGREGGEAEEISEGRMSIMVLGVMFLGQTWCGDTP